jgi:hypothetical protein
MKLNNKQYPTLQPMTQKSRMADTNVVYSQSIHSNSAASSQQSVYINEQG